MRAVAASDSPDVLSAGRVSPSNSLRGAAAAAGAAAAGASPLLDVATEGAAEERGVRPATKGGSVGGIMPAVGAVLRLRLPAERPLAEPRSTAAGLTAPARSRGAPAPRAGVPCGVYPPTVLRRPFLCASAPPLPPPPPLAP